MPKAKLKFSRSLADRVESAAEIADVKLNENARAFGDLLVVEASARSVANFFELGLIAGQLPADTKAEKKAPAEPKPAAANGKGK